MNAPLWRVFLADLLTKVENWFITKYNNAVTVLTNSAWAANNSVNVGMTETAEVLNPMLAEPSTEQIYTTQPQWDFDEGESLQLGSMVWLVTEGDHEGDIVSQKGADSDIPLPIPSLVYDTDDNAHVVFPVWMWDETEEKYGFKPMPITYRHNLNVYGGGLDGFQWAEVSLISGESVTVTGSTASVPTSATVAVGTWVRLTYEESDASKTAYGYVSALGENEVTVTVVGTCGETVTKVELYKPLGQ